ncbi:MAG: hypothetical protein ACI9LX_001152 [Paraglaciecola sp.]|jgi:hypothetical protein
MEKDKAKVEELILGVLGANEIELCALEEKQKSNNSEKNCEIFNDDNFFITSLLIFIVIILNFYGALFLVTTV